MSDQRAESRRSERGGFEVEHLLWIMWVAIIGCVIAAVWTTPHHIKHRIATTGDRFIETAAVLFGAMVVTAIVYFND